MCAQKISPYKWAYKHTQNLKKQKEILENMSVINDIDNYISNLNVNDYSPGYWTLLKNISLAYCINPFGVILKKNDMNDTVFLDLFSGSGITPMKDPSKEKIEWTVGSPIISTVMTDYPFKKYYFCDTNENSRILLENIMESLEQEKNIIIDYETSPEDANRCFQSLYDDVKTNYVLAFIDPTGFQWDWVSMERLLKLRRFDIIMNFQTSQVDRIPGEKEKLFFGPCAEDLSTCRDREDKLKLYISQIEDLGSYVSDIRIGKDTTDRYYYHLLHISPRYSYKDIITTLKDKVERFTGKSIKKVWDDLYGYSRQETLQIE